MRESLVNILKINREKLMQKINIDENFWTRLVNNGTLTSEHTEKCNAGLTKAEKLERLLDMMERRDNSCFQKFCDALRVTNPDVVRHYLEVTPPTLSAQPETEQCSSLNLSDHLAKLRSKNAELQGNLETETRTFNELEIENTRMQNKLEEAKNKVRECQSKLEKKEENYDSGGSELTSEKVRVEQLEKQKEALEAVIDRLNAQLEEKTVQKKNLEEEVNSKTLENKKFGKQISLLRRQWSSRGSRSRDEGE